MVLYNLEFKDIQHKGAICMGIRLSDFFRFLLKQWKKYRNFIMQSILQMDLHKSPASCSIMSGSSEEMFEASDDNKASASLPVLESDEEEPMKEDTGQPVNNAGELYNNCCDYA